MRLTDALRGEKPQDTVSFLPALPDMQLIGRDNLLKIIDTSWQKLKPGARISLMGVEGVGKTSIALVSSHNLLSNENYEMVFWLDCQVEAFRSSSRVRSTHAANEVADIIRCLAHGLDVGLDDAVALRATNEDRQEIVRSRLAGRSCLIVADNLEGKSGKEIALFLYYLPTSVDVLVTSTMSVGWETEITVERLSISESITLLKQEVEPLVQLSTTQSEMIVSESSGLPLVLMYMAQMIKIGLPPHLAIADLEQTGSNDLLDHLHARKWAEIETGGLLMELLLLVASTPSNFQLVELLEVISYERENLNQLHNCLLDAIKYRWVVRAGDTIHMEPTARKYILSKIPDVKKAYVSILSRWLRWIDSKIVYSCAKANWNEAFLEIDTFAEMMFYALSRSQQITSIPVKRAATSVVLHSSYYMFCRGYWNELIETEKWTVKFAVNEGLSDLVLESYLMWAVKARRQQTGDEDALQAFELIAKKLPKSEFCNEPRSSRLWLARNISQKYSHNNQDLAQETESRGTILLNKNDLEWASRAFNRAGNLYAEIGLYNDSDRCFTQSRKIAEAAPSSVWTSELIGLSIGNRGIVANRRLNHREAVDLLQESLSLLVQEPEITTVWVELAYAYSELGLVNESQESFNISNELRNRFGLVTSMCESQPGWDLSYGQ